MNLYTNINIISQEYGGAYNYFIDFMDEKDFDDTNEFFWRYDRRKGICQLVHNENDNYEQIDVNSWKSIDIQNDTTFFPMSDVYGGKSLKTKKVRVQFPVYSLSKDTDEEENFILEVYTYINGVKIMIGCGWITKTDSLTHKCIKRLTNEYYEYRDIWIIDPLEFCYSDDWANFRENTLGEIHGTNNTGSLVSFSMTPVTLEEGNVWLKSINEDGGVNSVMLDTDNDDDMRLRIGFLNDHKYTPCIDTLVTFNPLYDSIGEYLKETYGMDCERNNIYASWELVVKDEENIWKQVTTEKEIIDMGWKPTKKFTRDEIWFGGWEEFGPGMEVKVTLNFYYNIHNIPEQASLEDWVPEERDEEFIMVLYLMSDGIYLTPDVFKFFIKDDIFNKKINYKNITNMKAFNITALNKIEKKIINVERSDNYKSNIIRPVFFRSQQTSSIQIHVDANENIAINLDAYKSKVSSFRLRIGGIDFVEVGRNNSGVIFKIVSSKLPKENYAGTYYIIDGNNEMVTSGAYEYI